MKVGWRNHGSSMHRKLNLSLSRECQTLSAFKICPWEHRLLPTSVVNNLPYISVLVFPITRDNDWQSTVGYHLLKIGMTVLLLIQ